MYIGDLSGIIRYILGLYTVVYWGYYGVNGIEKGNYCSILGFF